MNVAYKFRIYPTKEQKELLAKTFGCCRFLYNTMLSDKVEHYKNTGKMLYNTPAEYKKQYPFLKEVDSLALANVQLHLEKAYKNFFRRPETGFPKYKSKHRASQSYTTNVVNGNICLTEKRLKLPKVKEIRIKVHREIPENVTLKSVTVSLEPTGKYYASLLYVYESSENQAGFEECKEKKVLGIDYAMHGLAVYSDGRDDKYEGYLRKSEKKLAGEQRKLSHCQKGSSNYYKQRKRVAKVHEKIRNQRKDYIHKLTRKIADEYDVVGVEDIDMKVMSGEMHFGKSVMDNGYGMFRDILQYKLEKQGKQLVKVDKYFPSSKKCCKCGHIKAELRLSERIYRCECGNVMDRDKNAAVNIREEVKRMISA